MAVLLILLVVMGVVPTAQGQDMQGPSWEMGWVTDVDPKYTVELEEDWDLFGELVVFVSNDGPTAVNLDLTYDHDDGPFSFDGPDSIEVGGNSNDTFTVSITGGDADTVRAFSPSSTVEFTITAEEKVGDSTLRNQELSADVTVPRMYRLVPDAVEPTDTLFAGSWVDFTLEVSNLGNTQDAITTGKATVRSCPHLSVAGLEQLENTVVQVTDAEGTNKATFTLRLEASSTHQERSCEVSISVVSEGDNAERSSTFNVNVEAPTAEEETPVSDGEGDDERPSVPESTSLPSLSLVELLAVLMFVSIVALRPRD